MTTYKARITRQYTITEGFDVYLHAGDPLMTIRYPKHKG